MNWISFLGVVSIDAHLEFFTTVVYNVSIMLLINESCGKARLECPIFRLMMLQNENAAVVHYGWNNQLSSNHNFSLSLSTGKADNSKYVTCYYL